MTESCRTVSSCQRLSMINQDMLAWRVSVDRDCWIVASCSMAMCRERHPVSKLPRQSRNNQASVCIGILEVLEVQELSAFDFRHCPEQAQELVFADGE